MTEPATKQCPSCLADLPLAEFQCKTRCGVRLRPRCRACGRLRVRKALEALKDRRRLAVRESAADPFHVVIPTA